MSDTAADVLAAALRHIRDLCDLSVEDMREQHGSEQRVLMAVIPSIVDAALAQQGVTLTREPGLDVERLAVAIRKVERENDLRYTDLGIKPMEGPPPHWYEGYAAEVAREYAALASEDRT